MGKRENLHSIFIEILGTAEEDESRVYFQPPTSVKLKYPAIVYSRSKIDVKTANNLPYMESRAYEVTVIDYDPDSEFVSKVAKLPFCRFDRHFTSDNLNHDVFTIYF